MRLNEFIIESESATFIGACDRLRRQEGGEDKWQAMMRSKREISEQEFLSNVDINPLLDTGETWREYKQSIESDLAFYESDHEYFFQHAGFEFIWNKNGV